MTLPIAPYQRTFTLSAFLAIILLALMVGCSPGTDPGIDNEPPAQDEGTEFMHTSIDGSKVSLSDYRGKVVLVKFWASWCSICRGQTGTVKQLWTKYRGQDFVIIGVSLDYSIDSWKNYVQSNGLDWVHVGAGLHFDDPLAQRFNIRGTPTYLLFDKAGKQIGTSYSVGQLDTEIAKLLDL